jgi:molybdopterin molybdotransferase
MTGAAVPDYFDVIIKREDTSEQNNTVTIQTEKFQKWMNIAMQGEDAKQGTKVGGHGSLVDDSFLTIAASIGYGDLYVFTPPSISLISTGNEILPVDGNPLQHQIRDSNSVMIRGMLRKFKARIQNLWTIPDNPQLLLDKISGCLKTDLCIITGGVSAGDADYIPAILKSLGVEEIFHKVKIRPGKPIWFGKKGETLFFGLPGNPVSARITFKVFVEPCILKFLHRPKVTSYYLPLLKARKKKHDFEEYFRVKIINEGNHSYLQEIPSNGSGDFISSLHSDGIAIHPAAKLELPQNEQTQFLFW